MTSKMEDIQVKKNLLQKVGIAGKEKKEGEQEVIIKNGGGCQVNK